MDAITRINENSEAVTLTCQNPNCPKPGGKFVLVRALALRTQGTNPYCSYACYSAVEQADTVRAF